MRGAGHQCLLPAERRIGGFETLTQDIDTGLRKCACVTATTELGEHLRPYPTATSEIEVRICAPDMLEDQGRNSEIHPLLLGNRLNEIGIDNYPPNGIL